MTDRPDRPTKALLRKILAVANDDRGDLSVRRAAKRKLRLYAEHYPDLIRRKTTPNDLSRDQR
jgi:hypothetical protein